MAHELTRGPMQSTAIRVAAAIVVAAVALILVGAAYGVDCPDGRCPNVPQVLEWKRRPDDPARVYLFRNGVQVGGWDYDRREWRAYNAARKTWGDVEGKAPATVPPLVAPSTMPAGPAIPIGQMPEGEAAGQDPNFGIDVAKLNASIKGRSKYVLNGRDCTRDAAFAALEGVPDDSDYLRITYIGSADTAEKIRADLSLDNVKAACAGRCVFQHYTSIDAPIIRGLGFVNDALWIQTPAGQVLHGQTGYRGADKLAEAIAAAEGKRRRNPDFDPNKVPDLNIRPKVPDEPKPLDGLRDMASVTAWIRANWLVLVVAVGGAWAFWRRK